MWEGWGCVSCVHVISRSVAYYEMIKGELNKRLYTSVGVMKDSKIKLTERSTRLTYTVLIGGMNHLKIETRNRNLRNLHDSHTLGCSVSV